MGTLSIRALTAILMTLGSPLFGGGLHLISERRLTDDVNAAGATELATSLPVLAIRFSPDGGKLAVAAGLHRVEGKLVSSLFVYSINGRAKSPVRFDISPVVDTENDRGVGFNWSPDGSAIDAGGEIIDLRNEVRCDLPAAGGFLDEHTIVTIESSTSEWMNGVSHIRLYDKGCRRVSQWDVDESWAVKDISQDRRLLLVTHPTGPRHTNNETLIIDPVAKQIVQRWLPGEAWGQQFGNRGEAICAGNTLSEPGRFPPHCYNVNSGTDLGAPVGANGGLPISAARHASRLVVSDYSYIPIPLTDRHRELLQKRTLWDFRTGLEVISWHPPSEEYDFLFSRNPKKVTEPFRFDISPDGNYIAEGGAGVVKVYSVRP